LDQDELAERIDYVLRDDPRVLAAWVAGSRARGTADQFSDIDVWAVVSAAELDGFLECWPQIADRISPTVFRQQIRGGQIFNHITPEWLLRSCSDSWDAH
jgi:predicted nucleotidyltransferase